ncbi:hypothetical protein [Bacillus sp. FJAT-22090]|uniref:hypothetical protein n=1 Tax=Bacillus sp. FJAT-22090 TaxID=1581038 RepID=UPI0011A0547D|nr:hypothetical protein [Bacillus sp. FJAT-22090]
MTMFISIILGLALGMFLGMLIVQYVFNNGERPTTFIEDEQEVEQEIKAASTSESINIKI